MENTTNLKKKKPLFLRLARFFFLLYMITLYLFVGRLETVLISRLTFILYAGFTVLVLLQRRRINIGKNVLTAYISVTWMYAATFWAKNSFYASYKMGTVWLVFLLFFLTYNLFSEEEDAHEYLVKCLYISGIVLIIYSMYTYGINQVIQMMTLQDKVRLGSEISQANTFGMMNAMTIMIAFYYMLYKNRFKLLHIPVIAGAFLFAMSSGSRKALLMMCIGVLFLVYKKYGIKKLYKVVAIIVVLVLVFMAIIRLPMFDYIRHRLEQAVDLVSGEGNGDASAEIRMNMILEGWRIFKDRILFGYGANNFAILSRYGVYAHNNFIEILVDFGLIGFVLHYLSYVMALGLLSKSKNDASKVLLSIFLVRLLMEVAMVTYYDKLHWLLLAFFLINEKKEPKPEEISDEEEFEEIESSFAEDEEVIEESDEACEETEEDYYESDESFEENPQSRCEPEACISSAAE